MKKFRKITVPQDLVSDLVRVGLLKIDHEGKATIDHQADGAIPNGARVVKQNAEQGDTHPDGTPGTVIGSLPPVMYQDRLTIMYCIEWGPSPGIPVFTVDYKVKLMEGGSE